jgi:hypothetical protein
MLTSVICLCFRSGSLRSGFPSKIICVFLLLLMHASVRPILYSLACYINDIRSRWTIQITLWIIIKQQAMKLRWEEGGGDNFKLHAVLIFDTVGRWVSKHGPLGRFTPRGRMIRGSQCWFVLSGEGNPIISAVGWESNGASTVLLSVV